MPNFHDSPDGKEPDNKGGQWLSSQFIDIPTLQKISHRLVDNMTDRSKLKQVIALAEAEQDWTGAQRMNIKTETMIAQAVKTEPAATVFDEATQQDLGKFVDSCKATQAAAPDKESDDDAADPASPSVGRPPNRKRDRARTRSPKPKQRPRLSCLEEPHA